MIQPNLSPVPGKDEYALLNDYKFVYGNITILVPGYFIYDGASIPSFAWKLTYTPFHPDIMAPALVHDWLYLNHQVTREMADQIFYDMLILNEVPSIKAKLMHQALRLAGFTHWNNSKKDIQKLKLLYTLIKKNDDLHNYNFPIDVIFDH